MILDSGDVRLDRAIEALHTAMQEQQSVCLRQLGKRRAGEVRFGRALGNRKTKMDKLIEGICRKAGQHCTGRHVLLIEDTSELNYQRHAGRVRGLGVVGNSRDAGLFIHPVLAIDAQKHKCRHGRWMYAKHPPAYRMVTPPCIGGF